MGSSNKIIGALLLETNTSLPFSLESSLHADIHIYSGDITIVKSDDKNSQSAVEVVELRPSGGADSKGAISVRRHSNSPWPSKEEFSPFFESSTSVDTSIWKPIQRRPNEMPRLITKKELEAHKTKIDAWIVLFGKVFDISGYVDRHPGGTTTIEQGIGRDATAMFIKVHNYVDYDHILVRDFIGIYMPDFAKRVKKMNRSNWCRDICIPPLKISNTKKRKVSKFDIKFTENLAFLVIHITVKPGDGIILTRDSWTVILWDLQYILVKTVLTPPTCWVAEYCLKEPLTYEYLYLDFNKDFNRMSILIKKPAPKMWKTLGEPHLENNCSVIRADEIEDETLCYLFHREHLTKDVILVAIRLRPSSFVGVPVGYSIRLTINGVSSWYTPVEFSLVNRPEPEVITSGESIYLIMKTAPEAILNVMVSEIPTRMEYEEDSGIYMTVGCVLGTFNINFLEDVDVLVLLAKGSGIIPMIKIIQHHIDRDQGSMRGKQVVLLYFNKNSTDIIWRNEWAIVDARNEWFHAFLTVEEPEADWDQLRGQLTVHLVKWCLEAVSCISPDSRLKGIASGDMPFKAACERLFNLMKDDFDKTFTFVDNYG